MFVTEWIDYTGAPIYLNSVLEIDKPQMGGDFLICTQDADGRAQVGEQLSVYVDVTLTDGETRYMQSDWQPKLPESLRKRIEAIRTATETRPGGFLRRARQVPVSVTKVADQIYDLRRKDPEVLALMAEVEASGRVLYERLQRELTTFRAAWEEFVATKKWECNDDGYKGPTIT